MKWTTTGNASAPVDLALVANHLRLEDVGPERDLLTIYIQAATDYAEQAMECSLMPQTVTAVFYAEDMPRRYQDAWGTWQAVTTWDLIPDYCRPSLDLPRGPVTDITSVVDGNGNEVTNYTLERMGHRDRIRIHTGYSFPLTVTYSAGYEDADAVPASIRAAILAHVGSLYEQRESITEGSLTPVPHSLEDFYARRKRGTGIG